MSLAGSAPLPTIVFVAFSALTIAGCGSVSIDFGGETTTRVETETVPVDGLSAITITTDNGAVDVTGADVETVTIRAELTASDDDTASFSADTDDERLTVLGSCDDNGWSKCEVAFDITVPHDFDVRIATDNGAVDVTGVEGDLHADSDNGRIRGHALASPVVEAASDNGRIDLSFTAAPTTVDAETDNGAVDIEVPEGRYAVDADSDNGSVDVAVGNDPDSDRTIRVRTDNGAIDVMPVGP